MKKSIFVRMALPALFAARSALAEPQPSVTPAQVETVEPPPVSGVDRLITMWRGELGYRGAFVSEPGYHPFSTQAYFVQSSISLSRTLLAQGRFSFAPGLAWDYGRSTATARGDATSLEVHRFVVPLEARLHVGTAGTWGYAFLRAAPGVALENIEVVDASSPVPTTGSGSASLTKSRWLFATDISAGYALPLWPRVRASEAVPRVWLQSDAGYGWIAAQHVAPMPNLPSGDPRLVSGPDLGSLAMRGAFFRVAGAVSF